MQTIDYIVLLIYVAGIFGVGAALSSKVRTSDDLFSAGGQSPWWASGLSGFMTMFSAGTFVVWGGIAYRLGLVAVMINLCYGVAALLVGWFVAGHWKRLGIRTPAEFIERRFGNAALHFYTWTMMLYRMVGTGVALYSLAILLINLMPLAEGNPFRDPATGNLSLTWAVLLFGGCVVIYTMLGGLWAVLMTDVLQFIVLNLAVIFMIPLLLGEVGGFSGFTAAAPAGFFALTSGSYTWFFLAGWCAIHFFMVGAEWAFVQRWICVPTPRDARRSAYLFGVLYLVSPVLWLAPPLVYRVISPIPDGATDAQIQALSEGAYINACKHILPVGMLGLILAAMFSATASMVSSQLNVFAGVLTKDVYQALTGRTDEQHLVLAGRLFSLLLGTILVGLALAVPALGGAEKVVVAITALLVTPLLAPTIWGLFNRRVTSLAVWGTALPCFAAGLLAKYVFTEQLADFGRAPDIFLGVVLPVAVLVVLAALSPRKTATGWEAAMTHRRAEDETVIDTADRPSDPTPAYIVAGSLLVCSLMMFSLVAFNDQDRGWIVAFGGVLLGLAALIGFVTRYRSVPSQRSLAE